MHRYPWALSFVALSAACANSTATTSTQAPTPAETASPTPPIAASARTVTPVASTAARVEPSAPRPPAAGGRPCGTRPGEWCPSPEGDPCGVHQNVAACKADPKCKGMPYRGESFAPCRDDGNGFSSNCPNVGCISR